MPGYPILHIKHSHFLWLSLIMQGFRSILFRKHLNSSMFLLKRDSQNSRYIRWGLIYAESNEMLTLSIMFTTSFLPPNIFLAYFDNYVYSTLTLSPQCHFLSLIPFVLLFFIWPDVKTSFPHPVVKVGTVNKFINIFETKYF